MTLLCMCFFNAKIWNYFIYEKKKFRFVVTVFRCSFLVKDGDFVLIPKIVSTGGQNFICWYIVIHWFESLWSLDLQGGFSLWNQCLSRTTNWRFLPPFLVSRRTALRKETMWWDSMEWWWEVKWDDKLRSGWEVFNNVSHYIKTGMTMLTCVCNRKEIFVCGRIEMSLPSSNKNNVTLKYKNICYKVRIFFYYCLLTQGNWVQFFIL